MAEYFIIDLRRSFRSNPYVTLWRPENAGYTYPLPWAGRYSHDDVREHGDYYAEREGRALSRFAVPCDQAEKLAVDPKPGLIDGNAGPVIINNAENRRKLRRMAVNANVAISA